MMANFPYEVVSDKPLGKIKLVDKLSVLAAKVKFGKLGVPDVCVRLLYEDPQSFWLETVYRATNWFEACVVN
jgi:hypothetical protein